MKKVNRALYGPSMSEVILGASLSVVLGAVLGFAYLVFKPVVTVKEIPKEPAPNAVFYIPGPRGGANTGMISAKRKMLLSGTSTTLTEEEINSFASFERPAPAKPKPVAGAKADAAAAPQGDLATVGTPNVRIRDGEMQVAVPVKFSVLGLEQDVLVQTRGTFVRADSGFVYAPNKVLIGSCPAGRIPGMTGWVMRKVLLSKPLPDDIAAAWAKLADVSIVGSTLKLTF